MESNEISSNRAYNWDISNGRDLELENSVKLDKWLNQFNNSIFGKYSVESVQFGLVSYNTVWFNLDYKKYNLDLN